MIELSDSHQNHCHRPNITSMRKPEGSTNPIRPSDPEKEIPLMKMMRRKTTMSNEYVETNKLKTVYKFSALTAAALLAASTAIALVGAAISN